MFEGLGIADRKHKEYLGMGERLEDRTCVAGPVAIHIHAESLTELKLVVGLRQPRL